MKAVAAVVVALALLAGGFAAYRWFGGDDERDRAEAAAAEYSAYGTKRCDTERAEKASLSIWQTPGAKKMLDEMTAECKRPYEVRRLEPVRGNIWLLLVRDAEEGTRCMELDLARFQVIEESSVYVGGTVEGLSDAPCGPEWWTADQATQALNGSPWARERRARLVSCLGERGSPGRSRYFQRFTCRYSSPEGDGVVTLRTTGGTTFDIANPS